MKDVEQHQMGETRVGKGELVGITNHVQPGIGKKIGRDDLRQVRFEIAYAGAKLDDLAGKREVDQLKNFFVEARVDVLQQRFRVPGSEISLDFSLMLRQRRAHEMNFRRRAAKMTIRNRSHP